MTVTLPANVDQPQNGTFTSLLSQLRDRSLKPSKVRSLVRDMTAAMIKSLHIDAPKDETIAIIVVLRSGLAMFDGFVDNIPEDVSTTVYHMGIFRDQASLQPVEYYNKLPVKPAHIKQAYILDPLIATGGTAAAVISILKDWGIEKITFLSMMSTPVGLRHAAAVWPEGSRFVVGAIDPDVDAKGYVQPGVGDIGDRLYGTAFD
ncbi:phosphoribosyl transferase [Aspergillus eucalypticola CBS 122712]|uniref:uracil phosphoribosyltransferase n=1 Tax=Aspergillus eucalypticola (strain CBS 122712 / IBT 29274) TaxID=1448314 RepID=A0A317VT05_ASPEC|nr:phosphoribosyl transferase [Aspergillus eucalypticola CBS 122712]PWY75968.1 phosphoribosyl transferase [Aspergillus eucalypticola CBS 122712]